jgi:hypothetical protein
VHRMRMLVVALVAMALSFTGLSAANAGGYGENRAPQIKNLGAYAYVDRHDRELVRVTGTYKCFGGRPIHLWVSVKQGGPDPTAEGSSSTVDAWYDTNISMDVYVKCDGRWHTRTVKLGAHPTDFTGRELGLLKNGKAWLQFCLVAGEDEANALLASKSRWVKVRGAKGGYGGPVVLGHGYGPAAA